MLVLDRLEAVEQIQQEELPEYGVWSWIDSRDTSA